MKTCVVSLKSAPDSPFSPCQKIQSVKPHEETHRDFEARVWRERIHVNSTGRVVVPQMMLKNTLAAAAKFLGIQIPGKGKSNYTKHFEAGIFVLEPLVLAPELKLTDVDCEWLFVPADGMRGGGKRVDKCFPIIREWSGDATFHVVDDTITQDVFEQHMIKAGQFIGYGRFRPRQNGYYGRFVPQKFQWN